MSGVIRHLPPIPMVGRSAELAAIRSIVEATAAGRGSTLFLTGDGGIGKTRLVSAVVDEVNRRDWLVAAGRAYPVETDVPYALFADALMPWLLSLDPHERATLTRGVDRELNQLFPALGGGDRPHVQRGDTPGEFKNRLLWNFTEVVKAITERAPVLVVLEDLQWADASTLELLHFVARQTTGHRILFVGTYRNDPADNAQVLAATESSLSSLGIARVMNVEPIGHAATEELVRRVFGADPSVTGAFTAMLYGWTRGNPFFIQETLGSLVESGRLRFEHGHWRGWDVEELLLPRSVRDVVLQRTRRLGTEARAVADVAAVIGARVRLDALNVMSDLTEPRLLAALEELVRGNILHERLEAGQLLYDFTHPIVRETIYTELGLTRARLLHATVAQALELFHGDEALSRAGELAYHYSRAQSRSLAGKAATYLGAAGRDALGKYANREAAHYLAAALDLASKDAHPEARTDLVIDLARARQRLGEYAEAMTLWERALAEARAAGDFRRIAAVERRLGHACFWSGRPSEALAHYDAGLAAAASANDRPLQVQLHLAKGLCLQETGRPKEAVQEGEDAIALAETEGPALLGRAHRALMLLYLWTGPSETARAHGAKAIELAAQVDDPTLAHSAHWAMAMLSGISGDAAGLEKHLDQSRKIADALRSPVLRLWSNELEVEHAAFVGNWDTAIALGDHAIDMARALNQRTLLPRLLVWTGLVYLNRNDIERGKAYVDEAWEISGAGRSPDRFVNVHTVVPAHIGIAGYHMATGNYAEAIRVGEAGLALADRSGSTVWSIYRLIPTIAEASLFLGDVERARRLGERLHRDSDRLDHKLGHAWASACDALVVWLGDGDIEGSIAPLRQAAELLEAIPFVPDAARVRRQLAGRLADVGDREGALRELRYCHDVFTQIGAERELIKTREQMRKLDARPPARQAPGAAGLTGRELEIARLVAERKSNKAIGKALDISSRTVSTHISNIFRKLEISSRGELVDYVRRNG